MCCRYDKYTYAACAGTIGGLSVLFGSCTGKSLALDGFDAFDEPAFYAFLISMLVCVVVQTHLLNESMQLGGTMAVFPVFEAFWISFGVFGGESHSPLKPQASERVGCRAGVLQYK